MISAYLKILAEVLVDHRGTASWYRIAAWTSARHAYSRPYQRACRRGRQRRFPGPKPSRPQARRDLGISDIVADDIRTFLGLTGTTVTLTADHCDGVHSAIIKATKPDAPNPGPKSNARRPNTDIYPVHEAARRLRA